MIAFEVAYDKLMTFETAESIREYFQDVGIVGTPTQAFSCPIANWFKAVTEIEYIAVASQIYTLGHGLTDEGEVTPVIDDGYSMSAATQAFVYNFDMGMYQELLAEGS